MTNRAQRREADARALAAHQPAADAAADRLTLGDAVGLAVRDHRRRLGLSQRAYAAHRARPPTTQARLETVAGRFRLDDLVAALEGTGFALVLARVGDPESGAAAAPVPVDPHSWPVTELVARVRDGRRRFPAHHETRAVRNPPTWWWVHEFFRGGAEPQWYAPQPPRPLSGFAPASSGATEDPVDEGATVHPFQRPEPEDDEHRAC